MSKQVTVILPREEVRKVSVPDDQDGISFSFNLLPGGPGELHLPIETIEIDGETHYYAAYSALVDGETIKKAIAQ